MSAKVVVIMGMVIDPEPPLVGSDKCLKKAAGEALTVNPGAPGLTGPAIAMQTGHPEFPKKFWKGAKYVTGHWYNRTIGPTRWRRETLTPALSQRGEGDEVPDGRCSFSIWLWEMDV